MGTPTPMEFHGGPGRAAGDSGVSLPVLGIQTALPALAPRHGARPWRHLCADHSNIANRSLEASPPGTLDYRALRVHGVKQRNAAADCALPRPWRRTTC